MNKYKIRLECGDVVEVKSDSFTSDPNYHSFYKRTLPTEILAVFRSRDVVSIIKVELN